MNGQETEVKFYVKDLGRIEMCLRELKAHLIQPRVHEINFRFDNAEDSMRKNFKVLRLRQDTEAKFTFKGPSEEHEGGVLSRREIEFKVESFDAAKEFLEALGFMPILFYEKYRVTYELDHVHIMLDELPYGNFIEIESEDIDAIQKTAQLLDLDWNASIKAGYHDLFERMTEKFKLDPSQLSFDALHPFKIHAEDLNISPAD